MEEEKDRINGLFHTLNFIGSCGLGFVLLLVGNFVIVYIIMELLFLINFIVHKRKKDAIILILTTLSALIIGFSICAYQLKDLRL